MKRIFLFVLLISAVLGLPVTAGYAQQALDPGCSQEMMNVLQDQADAVRARNRAYEREILNREPSTLYLTCFDQAMVLSSRLGYIFSDNVPANPPPANTVVFTDGPNGTVPPGAGAAPGTLAFPGWGARHLLALDLDTVVSPELDNELTNNFLPPWTQANNQLTQLVTTLQPIITQIINFQTGADANNETLYIALVMKIDALVNSFPTLALPALPAAEAKYTADIALLNALITTIESLRQTNMGKYLASLKEAVFDPTMPCTNMDDLWNGAKNFADPNTTDFIPPEGNYYPLSPYFTLADLLNNGGQAAQPFFVLAPGLVLPQKSPVAAQVPPPNNATLDFYQELKTDSPILNQALSDLSTQGAPPFAAPGNSTLWPLPPVFTPGSNALAIIKQM